MIARPPNCYRNRKTGRDAICSAGEVVSLAANVKSSTTWGKVTSRRYPPAGVFEELARRWKTSVVTIRRLWEQGMI